jgi:hypothetical protein
VARYISDAADLAANGGKLPDAIPETARRGMVARGAGLDVDGFRVDAAGTVLARMAWPRHQAIRAALGGYPAFAISALTSSPAGLFGVAWAPARSARLTRMAAIVMMRAISMIPADTSNPRAKPADSAWS